MWDIFLMVLSTIFLLSIPFFECTHIFFNTILKKILLISDYPDENHHIGVSTTGPSTRILIEENKTSSELAAEIMVESRRDTFHYFLFNANAKEEK